MAEQVPELVITRTINGAVYNIEFCAWFPWLPWSNTAYRVTRNGEVIAEQLLMWEAKKVIQQEEQKHVRHLNDHSA